MQFGTKIQPATFSSGVNTLIYKSMKVSKGVTLYRSRVNQSVSNVLVLDRLVSGVQFVSSPFPLCSACRCED